MCQHQYEYEGYKTYSPFVPTSCQGCYFPGDEPGIYCEISGGMCQNPEGSSYEDCNFQEQTDRLCPECKDVKMIEIGDGTVYCRECGYAEKAK